VGVAERLGADQTILLSRNETRRVSGDNARCSTGREDLTAQRDALTALEVDADRIYVDHGLTGTDRKRPGLREAMAACHEGSTLVVAKLDRLARSVRDAGDIADELTRKAVKLSIGGSVHDPTDPVGKLLFNALAMIAEFSVIWTRRDGYLPEVRAAARERGRLGGRPTALTPAKLKQARKMIREKTPLTEVAQVLGVSRATLYRRVPELAGVQRRRVTESSATGAEATLAGQASTTTAVETGSGCLYT